MQKFATLKLDEYVEMGGLIENLDLNNTNTRYEDKESLLRIISIKQNGFNTYEKPLYDVVYVNQKTARYVGHWIETKIEIQLPAKYKTKKNK